LRAFRRPGRIEVAEDDLLQVVADRDLARFPTLLLEVQHPLVAGMIEAAAAERSHGAGTGGGVDQDGDDGATAQPHHHEVSSDAKSCRAPATVISGVLPSTIS
jgi:hypothetical protein